MAEHLSPEAGAGLVASLARHGDVLLFSAASPGRGGEFHVNERSPEYWRSLHGSAFRLTSATCVETIIA